MPEIKRGRPRIMADFEHLNVRVTPQQMDWLLSKAHASLISRSAVLRMILDTAMQEEGNA